MLHLFYSLAGLLAIAKALDREAVDFVKLQIIARDHGYPQLSSEVYITANIIDVNDNKPKFTQQVYNASIQENQPVGTFVTAVSAIDPDQGKEEKINQQFRMQILGTNDRVMTLLNIYLRILLID